jgi:predicted nucleic acid-binding protein
MTYLLDANVLIALGYTRHQSHRQVGAWVSELRATGGANFATCAITELAFVRVGAQAGYYVDVAMAKKALHVLKTTKTATFRILEDDLGADALPAWAKTPNRTTDGHLLELAACHGVKLATLDKGIPRAFLIPG